MEERTDRAALDPREWSELARTGSAIAVVDAVIAHAVRNAAADVHFEPFEDGLHVRCRLEGGLREWGTAPLARSGEVAARLKVLAGMNVAEQRLPQDGRIRHVVAGRSVDLRVSTLPTQFGESVVLRILETGARRPDLRELCLPSDTLARLERVLQRPEGILLVTGPTGSGKTTTLYGCLDRLNRPETKILTVEDPVEYEVEGIMQVSVNPAAGLSFARALRAFLRQDPDVVVVGEIRDAETARIAVQASLTGHYVLSTLHTADSTAAVTRLADMGIEPFLLASTLNGAIAQRLVRRKCPVCRPPATSSSGCATCAGTGFRGRIAVFEYLEMTDALRLLLVQGASAATLRRAAEAEGLRSLRDAAQALAAAGEIVAEDIDRLN